MTILIYNSNIKFVYSYIENNPESVAFWYSPGLSSYFSLNEFVQIKKVLIEEDISNDFQEMYEEMLSGSDISTFKSPDSRKPSLMFNFYASNDTHVYLFKNILESLSPPNYSLYVGDNENGETAALKNKIPLTGGILNCTQDKSRSGLLVLGNDWGRAELVLNAEYLNANKNTVCIQESILDLNEKDGRLRNCSVPVFQGVNSLKNINLKGMICAVIGNPRFENLTIHPQSQYKKVFINVNFTYGIFEEIREVWVNDIIQTCKEINVDYIISQHPRDNGDFTNFNLLKSHPGIVHDTIIKSSVVVSRFSALILEAISLGRPAIYYNPHNEMMDYKFEADNETLFVARNITELKSYLELITSSEYIFSQSSKTLSQHLGNSSEGLASDYIIKLLASLNGENSVKSVSNWRLITLKLKLLKAKLFKQ
ncbi:hypothetical protein [Pedobacter sp. GR22-6]|uniref:hypothetical protein n=1 Tax=Pedobacter sp. GR22-6 TaxID=3127957 RepID=UPI00307EFC9D